MRVKLPPGVVRGAALLTLTLTAASAVQAAYPKGKPAPTWSGKTIAGKPITSAQFKGKVVVMNFFGYT